MRRRPSSCSVTVGRFSTLDQREEQAVDRDRLVQYAVESTIGKGVLTGQHCHGLLEIGQYIPPANGGGIGGKPGSGTPPIDQIRRFPSPRDAVFARAQRV